MNWQLIKTTVAPKLGRLRLHTIKVAPEIMVGAGIVGVVGATVLACRATLKADSILDQIQSDSARVKQVREDFKDTEDYTYNDYVSDMTKVYTRNVMALVKLYTPAVLIGLGSITLIVGSHTMLGRRNAALTAAYASLHETYRRYRSEVETSEGKGKDELYAQNSSKKLMADEEGITTELQEKYGEHAVQSLASVSPYARYFDEQSTEWTKNAEYNMFRIRSAQNYANDKLKADGHIFLNDVYELLGFPRSRAGAVVGWVLGNGDDFVDFGLFDSELEINREFMNGNGRYCLLDFNVDGVVWNLI